MISPRLEEKRTDARPGQSLRGAPDDRADRKVPQLQCLEPGTRGQTAAVRCLRHVPVHRSFSYLDVSCGNGAAALLVADRSASSDPTSAGAGHEPSAALRDFAHHSLQSERVNEKELAREKVVLRLQSEPRLFQLLSDLVRCETELLRRA
jgi:hypothetical protein